MSKVLSSATNETKAAVASLFDNTPPVLVEVRFPNTATAPDWHLLDEEEELEALLGQLATGSEVRLSSVWDLKNTKGDIRLRK
jgi:hypothetical protein